MLLKGILLEKTGRIRAQREKFNYGFDKCVNVCESQLLLMDKDEAVILRNLNGFRDAATHGVVDISEGLLYAHAQSAVQIFGTLLKRRSIKIWRDYSLVAFCLSRHLSQPTFTRSLMRICRQ